MKKIRYYLVVIALAATLGGPVVLQSTASLAHAAGKSAHSIASVHRNPPCPTGGTLDC